MSTRDFNLDYQFQDDPWDVKFAEGGDYDFCLSWVETLQPHSIVDLGCGRGRFTRRFKKLAENVIGIDVSTIAIDKAKAEYPAVDFRVGDLRTIQLFPADVFTCKDVIYYFQHDGAEHLVDEVSKNATIGAYFSIPKISMTGEELFEMVSKKMRVVRYHADGCHAFILAERIK